MKSFCRDFRVFFKRYERELLLSCLLLTLALFHYLYSANYRMDSTIKLAWLGDEFNDLELGRFGIVYLNRLFGMRNFTPYFMAYVTMLELWLSSALMGFAVWRGTQGRCGRGICAMPLIVFLTPNWVEQLYFSYQTFLILLGVLMLQLAALIPDYLAKKRWMLLEIALVLLAFSVYQSFVPMYIALCAATVLFIWIFRDDIDGLDLWRRIARHACVFAVSLAAYFIVNWLLSRAEPGTDYLTSQMRWGKAPIQGVLLSIVRGIASIVTGTGNLDTLTYAASALLSTLALTVRSVTDRRDKAPVAWLGWVLLQLSAFAMTLVMGNRMQLRTELAITFVTGFNFILALTLARDCAPRPSRAWLRRGLSLLTAAAMATCLYNSASMSLRLIYTDDIRSATDNRLAVEIAEKLKPMNPWDNDKTVVFIGTPEIALNAGCMFGEVIGRSMFTRIISMADTNHFLANLMAVHDVPYRDMTNKEGLQAEIMASAMPAYPAEGSIEETENLIVVKLSEDYYYNSEILVPRCSASDEEIVYGGNVTCMVDDIVFQGDAVTFRGFCFRRGVDAKMLRSVLYLRNCATGALYRVNTALDQRAMIQNQYWRDGVSYDQCGFLAKCPMDLLNQNPDDTYEVLVKYSLPDETGFVATRSFINLRNMRRTPSIPSQNGLMEDEEQ